MSKRSHTDGPEGESRTPSHDVQAVEPSAVAVEIRRLKDATLRAAAERTRLPQPLFWSLFRSQIVDLRKRKARARIVQDLG